MDEIVCNRVTLKSARRAKMPQDQAARYRFHTAFRNLYAEIRGGIEIVGVLMPVCFPSLC
jgi:hypothetical protein